MMIKEFNKWLGTATLSLVSLSVYSNDLSSLTLNQTSSALAGTNVIPATPNEELENGSFTKNNRNNLLLPGETDVRLLLPSSGEALPPPYGANLFAGGYETERTDGLNDNYLVAPGDKINIWLWGAVSYSDVVTVDNQGNIFVPEIGPIKVENVKASEVNSYVASQIKKVYTNNVSVYVNLLTATPVSIFLSGPVIRPGQYAGMASDSLLYFLKRAGGIDPERGSYRSIQIKRNSSIIADVDLYDFIRTGQLPNVSFKDGDIILVTPQKPAITVSGGVRNPFRFELKEAKSSGSKLIDFSRPLAKISHVGVIGNRDSGPFSLYMPYKDFQSFELEDGDKVIFNDDLHAQVMDIQVSGSYLGPSYFAVQKRTKLHDLLNYIPVDPVLANTDSIYILRQSVAERQKQMIEESLDRLERSVFTSPASSDGEATIRAKEAEMVLQFTERARKVEPLGKVVVSDKGHVANILLEQGDVIVIPNKTDLIQIGGEVLMPQAVVYNKDATIDDYIAWAGGFTERAEDARIAIVRANGLVEFDSEDPIEKGDQVLVLPKVDTKTMQAVKDITQIIYQIAIAANVAVN
ncbi:polysaccharide biosynthesis/export family protein [Vibrio natriegens]|jgi:protein involved in polysaccharide export with SLBB domain|uniref:Sugar transporter n=1 Tax=Vibrio natriegens NBRC 15636 = ATCC 14048 = DSM 759 TaxID=1219067 RepID=A0AAN0XZW3_VIBNA|nr:polysaccharide biosynthesis/export family protein [Vibrio natriegens]ALR16691.1 sugar transporter [Vibrio natriegens NBRC 15636 = ATCC 14048 = DSM 759]ANQ11443.1 sugar transporter [Vibrio natriegens NBRC 15636 = ATCC 14048 = DSM 759]EPM39008.1 sugar transporter [Vibrio natriegens NBRC 15636 = ATCC 14048 = DSM 759]MDX6025773.1 polysaccharide biosynthesis/export family protein [Vibrio natriegens NBRC 15636 = ATCC 14048 = DSM 759]UUI11891.1 polysaccharide export protein [Vibrio natriegens]